MIHSLELENFKAFGKRAYIPFAPITLIFGENSAGKSSILQALYLLKQTLESPDMEVLSLRQSENGTVDLGSFQDLLFDHDLERTLSIRIEMTTNALDIDYPPTQMYISNLIGIELSFKRPMLEEKIHLDQIGIYDGKSSKCIAKFKMLGQEDNISMNFTEYPRSSTPVTMAKCVWLTQEPEFWEPLFRYTKERKDGIIQFLEYRAENFLRDDIQKDPSFPNDSLNVLKDYIEFLSSPDFDLVTFISKIHKEETDRDILLAVHVFFLYYYIHLLPLFTANHLRAH